MAAPRPAATALSFVVQKHWASRLHYDFRLELDGVLLSWAVPKGPSFDPSKMQMAIHVEDHPLDYAGFEGTIPPRQYGAGTVIVWDRGTWQPEGDPRRGMAEGKLVFRLHGEKLAGLWELVRIAKPGDKQDAWMLFKKKDAWARPVAEYDVITALPDSVVAKPLGPGRGPRTREPRASREAGAARGPRAPGAASAHANVRDRRRRSRAAVAAPLPQRLEPQLATLVAAPPSGDWIVETKFDGYRLMARVEHGKAKLITRGGHDWTAKMKSLAAAVEALGIASAWLDGEIVVINDAGMPDFNLLQNAMDNANQRRYRPTSCSTCRSRPAATCGRSRWRRAGPRCSRWSRPRRPTTGSASARAFRRRRRRCSTRPRRCISRASSSSAPMRPTCRVAPRAGSS